MAPLPCFEDATWCRALSLAERVELARRSARGHLGDERLARRRVERLRGVRPFSDAQVFRTWLESHGWSEEDLRCALGARPEDLETLAGGPPPWWRELEQAYSRPLRREIPQPLAVDSDRPDRALVRLWYPVIVRVGDRLRRRAGELAEADPEIPFEPDRVVGLLVESLVVQLYEISLRTLVLELHVARLAGRLEGGDGEARFRSFVGSLELPRVRSEIFSEYPVLGRLAVEAAERWHFASAELLERLARDRRVLEETFHAGRPLGKLRRLRGGAGDRHRCGRSVQILELDSGLKLLYKPRSLAVDRHFRELLAWLDERGNHLRSRHPAVIDRGSYGWVEFVSADGCESPAGVERFYERQGGFLALLYALDANDFHYENVIASGEYPVLVDLESLFAQRLKSFDRTTAPGRAADAILHSVLRTGLLPRPTGAGLRLGNLDLSGLGAMAGQVGPAVSAVAAPGTDEMHIGRKERRVEGAQNLPTLAGEVQRAVEHKAAIERGFANVYQTILENREELLAPDGPLASFAGDDVRLILRGTRIYRLMELDGYHPDLLRDALDRDRHLDRLWLGVGNENLSPFVLRQEREELERLDVPLFSSRPGERRLYCGTGRHLDEFFESSGLEIVAARIGRLGERNLELQRWMVGASLTALDGGDRHRSGPASASSRDELEPPGPERLLAATAQIRFRLRELALVGIDGDVSWVGISGADEEGLVPMPLGLDLYAGLPGIALFLAYLAATDRDEESREMAEATWRTVGRGLAEGRDIFDQPGAFAGLGGVLYLALHLSRLWNRPELLSEAAVWAGWLEEWLPEDRGLDVLAGSAGCIPVLLALERATGESRYLDLAERCGDRVLSAARQLPEGIGWISPLAGEQPLSGFSHGGAGFAWALAQLARATGEERFSRGALGALAYERTLFDPGEGNWRDLRGFRGPEGGFSVAWCHGAVGIGLARLASLELELEGDESRRAEMRRELDVALETTAKYGAGSDHTLCHGALGNAELLARAGRLLDRPDAVRRAGEIAAIVCDEVLAGRFHCGVPGGYETPGLMDGLAGIGYGLLRLAAPETVPSVLLLEPPVGVEPVTTPRRREAAVAS